MPNDSPDTSSGRDSLAKFAAYATDRLLSPTLQSWDHDRAGPGTPVERHPIECLVDMNAHTTQAFIAALAGDIFCEGFDECRRGTCCSLRVRPSRSRSARCRSWRCRKHAGDPDASISSSRARVRLLRLARSNAAGGLAISCGFEPHRDLPSFTAQATVRRDFPPLSRISHLIEFLRARVLSPPICSR